LEKGVYKVASLNYFATLKATPFQTSPFGKGGLRGICILIEKPNEELAA
jgi:hypothetical protein